MKRIMKGIVSLAMIVCMITAFLVPAVIVRAVSDEELFKTEAEMNLDVVFVLDASGSMLTSDPNKVALDAFNLFVDLCDDTCSVGYVVYSEKIKDFSDLYNIKSKSTLDSMKKKIAGIEYDPNGDTDIALGLTKAMNLQINYRASDKTRKKVIILLSDGNTHLIGTTRTVEESKKEMETTLAALNEKGIPVYSIGLNYDKTLDKKELENISSKTKGQTFETSKSSELPGIASEIFGDIYQLEGEPKEIVDGTVTINIKDSSVFYVNVIIRSDFTLSQLDPQVTDPNGKKISIYNNPDLPVTSAGTYTLIKMIYPEPGNWTIKLKNANNENCKVTQLDYYSIYIKQEVPKAIALKDSVRITASVNDRKGVVSDEDLLKTIRMTSLITDTDGKEFTVVLNREPGTGVYTGTYTPQAFGTYRIRSTAISEKFQKDSRSASFSVKTAAEMDILNPEEVSEEEEKTESNIGWVIFGVVTGVIVAVIVILLLLYAKSRHNFKAPKFTATGFEGSEALEKKKEKERQEELERLRKQYQKEKPIVMPEAKDPDLVDYELVEHDELGNLIRKGPEDAFNADADSIKSDEKLESLIRKGPEDAFNTNAENIQTNEELEKLVRKGADDPFAVGSAENTEVDPSLGQFVKGDDDPFANFGGSDGLTVNDNDSGTDFGIHKDDDTFGGSGGSYDDNAMDFGIKKDDDVFGGGDDSIGSGFAENLGIQKDDDVFPGNDDSFGSGFAE